MLFPSVFDHVGFWEQIHSAFLHYAYACRVHLDSAADDLGKSFFKEVIYSSAHRLGAKSSILIFGRDDVSHFNTTAIDLRIVQKAYNFAVKADGTNIATFIL